MTEGKYDKSMVKVQNDFLRHTRQPVYPFYLLHQLIIVASGYYIVQLQSTVLLKGLLLLIVCFASLIFLYRLLMRPSVYYESFLRKSQKE